MCTIGEELVPSYCGMSGISMVEVTAKDLRCTLPESVFVAQASNGSALTLKGPAGGLKAEYAELALSGEEDSRAPRFISWVSGWGSSSGSRGLSVTECWYGGHCLQPLLCSMLSGSAVSEPLSEAPSRLTDAPLATSLGRALSMDTLDRMPSPGSLRIPRHLGHHMPRQRDVVAVT